MSIYTAEERFWKQVSPCPESGCWLWAAYTNRGGYGTFRWSGQQGLAHRYAWEAFRGPIPDGLWVLHRCDVRACVNPDHLYVGNLADNVNDMMHRGRQVCPRGERHPRARLSDADVVLVRRRASEGASYRRLAAQFSASKSAIAHVVKRRCRASSEGT